MATLVERAQELADVTYSSADEVALLLKWLRAGLLTLVRLIPRGELLHYTTELIDAGSGIALNGATVLGAHKANRMAIEWPVTRKAELADTNSLYEASTFSPAYYVDGNSLYVLPAGGTAVVVTAPSITEDTETVSNLPEQFPELATLFAAIRILVHSLYDLGVSLTVTTITAGTATSSNTVNEDVIAASTAIAGSIDVVADASTAKAASDTAATPEDALAATIEAVSDISSISVVATSFTNMTPPGAPGLDTATFDWAWEDSDDSDNPFHADQLPANLSITAPTYPTISFGNVPITATPPTAPTAPTITINDIANVSIAAPIIGSLPPAPSYSSVNVDIEWSNTALAGTSFPTTTDNLLDWFAERHDDDDSEMAGAVIGMMGQVLDKYQKDLFNSLNTFNANNADFQREVDRVLKQADIDLAAAIEQARLSNQVNITNELESARVDSEVYRNEAQAYAAAVQGYVGEINATIQTYIAEEVQTKLQKWLKEMDAELAEYQAQVQTKIKDQDKNIQVWAQKVNKLIEKNRTELQDTIQSNQNKIGLYQAEVSAYNAAVGEQVQQAQLEQQRKMTDAELASRIAIQNLQKDLARVIKQAELDTQAAINNAQLAGQVDTAVMQADLQGKISELQSDVQLSISNMQKDLERAITQAKMDTEVSLADLQADTSVKVAMLNADIQGKISILQGDIQAKIANLQAQVQADIAELQGTIQTNAQKIQTYLTRYEWLQGLWREGLQLYIGQMAQQQGE